MSVLAALVTATIALSGPIAQSPAAAPQQSETIRVVSSTHEIDFPNRVILLLEAEAETEITEVTLYYRLGRQRTRIYGYPDFKPLTRVTTRFEIRTGGPSYLPSGVDITYHYVIRDAAGNSFNTDAFSIEYKDPRFDWQSLRVGDLVVLWHDHPAQSVTEVAVDVATRLGMVKTLLGLGSVAPMKAVIVNTSSEAGQSFPLVSGAARAGHLYGGFAFGELDVFLLGGLSRDGMIHEMTHLLIDEALDSPLAKMPSWLNEGLAMYYESSPGARGALVERAARRGDLLPLRSMGSVPGRPDDVRLFYAQSWSLVAHIMETRGPEPMSTLLGALNQGLPIDEAIPVAYDVSLSELEAKWKADLFEDIPLVAPADPGTVGTSALIAGALAVAAAVVGFRWLRRPRRSSTDEEEDLDV